MVAMALALEPAALICGKPTMALDVITQAQVPALVQNPQRRRGAAFPPRSSPTTSALRRGSATRWQ